MPRITDTVTERAAQFLWLTGAVLDQRRLAHFTGAGDAAGVLAALGAHRTGDGGYAFALEPDVKGPAPQPLTAMAALEVLDQIGARADAGLLEWLASCTAPDGGVPDLLETIEDYPRPPWVQAPPQGRGGLLTTARIAGLLHRTGTDHPWLAGATGFCRNAIDAVETTHPYEVFSIVTFCDHVPDRDWAAAAADRIGRIVHRDRLVLLDPADGGHRQSPPGYAPEEHHLACDFAPSPASCAAAWFTDAQMQAALDHRAGEQAEDGGWPIHYRRWSTAIEQQARPGFTLAALRTLRAWNTA